jgi:Protein of unknown function (DUF664)
MNAAETLVDAFGRIQRVVHNVVDGLEPQHLTARIDGSANSIAWLVWHLARVQDDHVAEVAGTEQVWTAKGWTERFDLPFDHSATGFGHSSAEVDRVRVSTGDLLTGYYDDVHDQTVRFVGNLTDAELDRIVDERWDPPVSLGVRLVSVISDDLQHAGQAAFARGLVD